MEHPIASTTLQHSLFRYTNWQKVGNDTVVKPIREQALLINVMRLQLLVTRYNNFDGESVLNQKRSLFALD